jgi:hypothetical protein
MNLTTQLAVSAAGSAMENAVLARDEAASVNTALFGPRPRQDPGQLEALT